jgi:RsiW-degrading membrane proteinase PrsW (M82 family)
MKYFLIILFFAIVITLLTGFYIKTEDPKTGELLIGFSISGLFLVLIPLFIYHRWKNKNVKDYMLTKENIEKMQAYSKDKKL